MTHSSQLRDGSLVLTFEHHDDTRTGSSHTQNEDSRAFVVLLSADREPGALLFVVADGASGREGGQQASQIAVGAVSRHAGANYAQLQRTTTATLKKFLEELFVKAAEAVVNEARSSGPEKMSTTLTLVLLTRRNVLVGCVGDSPAYVWNGQVVEAVPHGKAGEPGAMLGAEHGEPKPILSEWPLAVGTQVLIATDGLAEVVPLDELAQHFRLDDPRKAVGQLMRKAEDGNARDDVTVALVRHVERAHQMLPRASAAERPAAEAEPLAFEDLSTKRPKRRRGEWLLRRVDERSLIAAGIVIVAVILALVLVRLRPWHRATPPAPPPPATAHVEGIDEIFAEQDGEEFAFDANAEWWVVGLAARVPSDARTGLTADWLSVQRPDRGGTWRLELDRDTGHYVTHDRKHAFEVVADLRSRRLYLLKARP